MPLQPQLMRIPFGIGLQESTQEEVLEPGQGFLSATNVFQDKRGSFEKRFGFRQQTKDRQDGTTRSKGVSLFSLNNQTCVYDGSRLDSYSSSSITNVYSGTLRNFSLETITPTTKSGSWNTNLNLDKYDVLFVSDKIVLSYPTAGTSTSYEVVISILDATTGANLLTHTIFPGMAITFSKLASIGNKVIAFYSDAANTISAIDIDLSTLSSPSPAWSSPNIVANDWDNVDWDVTSLRDLGSVNTGVMLAYTNVTVTTKRLTSATNITATTTHVTGGSTGSVACGGDQSGDAIIAWTVTGPISFDVFAMPLNPTTLVQSGNDGPTVTYPGTIPPFRLGVLSTGTNQFVVSCAQEDSPFSVPVFIWGKCNFTGPGPSLLFQGQCGQWAPITRPFNFGGKVLIHAGYAALTGIGNTQRTECILDISTADAIPSGNANMRLSGWMNVTGVGYLPEYRTSSMAVGYDSSSNSVYIASYGHPNSVAYSPSVLKMSVDKPFPPVSVSSDGIHLSGAVPCVFDGYTVAEEGFTVAPYVAPPSLSGPGTVDPGTYAYTAIFERVDASGNVWWSAPAAPVSVEIVGPAQNVTVTVQGYGATRSYLAGGQVVNVVLYRTLANGTVYYRVGAKTAGALTRSWLDTYPDGSLEVNPVLYTQPGTVGTSQPRQAPPPFTCETVHFDRVFGANGKNVWYSATLVDGEGVWFSDAFQFPVERGGNITGLSSQDGHLYIFKGDSIFLVDGQGPPESGGNGTEFSSPIELPTEVGCIDPRSIVRTQDGIMFQSTRGIEVLTRAQAVEWIGEPVRGQTAAFPVVTSAVLDEKTSRAIFTCAPSESASGPAPGILLVYNLNTRMWSVSNVTLGETAQAYACGAIVPDYSDGNKSIYAFVGTDGFVLNETQSISYDTDKDGVNTFIPMSVEVPWVKMAGLNGFQRIWRVQVEGEKSGPHDLTISIATDYEVGYPQTRTWTWDEINSFDKEAVEIHVKQQKSRSLRVKIADAPPTGEGLTGYGKTITMFGLAIKWGQKAGTYKLPAVQRG
mgnify:CR=1 FL=1